MDEHARKYVIASLCYLVLAFAGGVAILAFIWSQGEMPPEPFLGVHLHLITVGWLCLFVFGLGFYILPRVSGRPLHSVPLAVVQFWMLNVGIWLRLVCQPLSATYGIPVSYNGPVVWVVLAVVSAALEFLAIGIFAYNVIRTVFPQRS